MAGEGIFLTPEYILQDMPIDFFDFQFIMNADGSMKECKYGEQVLDPCIGQSLFLVREKYMKKIRQHKEDKKKLETHKELQDTWAKNRDHLQEHIRRTETKLAEYKNVILAFGKLATTNPISK